MHNETFTADSVPGFAREGFFGPELGEAILSCGKDYLRSDKLLPEWIRSLSGPPKMCYRNSAELALDYPEELFYVEGYAFADIPLPFPIAHAWTISRSGLVVDPTWKSGSGYFGISFTTEELREYLLLSEEYGILSSFWSCPRSREKFFAERMPP